MARSSVLLGFAALILWFAPSGAWAQARVACVGDSITYGYGLDNREQRAYPAVLGELLGAEFEVGNFGDSGSTLQNAGDEPWRAQPAYSECLAFAPNIVVILLGTNDAKPSNWSEASFVADYEALISEFRELGAEVYVATPPPVVPPGAFDIQATVVNEDIVPLVRQIAADASAPLIDVYAALEARPELLPDTVHPNAAGARVIAETVADALLTSDETASTATSSGTLSSTSASSSGGNGGMTSSSTATASASSATTTAQAGPPESSQQNTGSSSTTGVIPSTTGREATRTGAGSSGQATLAVTSAGTGTDTGGASAVPAEHEEGSACALGATAAPPQHTWFWILVALAALTRGRERLRRG